MSNVRPSILRRPLGTVALGLVALGAGRAPAQVNMPRTDRPYAELAAAGQNEPPGFLAANDCWFRLQTPPASLPVYCLLRAPDKPYNHAVNYARMEPHNGQWVRTATVEVLDGMVVTTPEGGQVALIYNARDGTLTQCSGIAVVGTGCISGNISIGGPP